MKYDNYKKDKKRAHRWREQGNWEAFIRNDVMQGYYIASVYCERDLEAWAKFEDEDVAAKFISRYLRTEAT